MPSLTTPQLQQLAQDITVTRPEVVYRGMPLLELWTLGEDFTLSEFYNEIAQPLYYVWRTAHRITAGFQGPGFDWTRVDNLTAGKARVGDWMIAALDLNFARPEVRAGVEQTFATAADQPCRQAIFTSAARPATYAEQLYANGPGQPPNDHGVGPSVMLIEGALVAQDVRDARAL